MRPVDIKELRKRLTNLDPVAREKMDERIGLLRKMIDAASISALTCADVESGCLQAAQAIMGLVDDLPPEALRLLALDALTLLMDCKIRALLRQAEAA